MMMAQHSSAPGQGGGPYGGCGGGTVQGVLIACSLITMCAVRVGVQMGCVVPPVTDEEHGPAMLGGVRVSNYPAH